MEEFIDIGVLDISSVDEELIKSKLDSLSLFRQTKVNWCRRPQSRRQSFGGGLLLEHMLRNRGVSNPEYKLSELGRPYIDGDVQFSISHSGDCVMCVVANCGASCDIELIKEFRENAFNYAFEENEKAYIGESAERLYELWTVKECVVKHKQIPLTHIKSDCGVVVTDSISLADESLVLRQGQGSNNSYAYALIADSELVLDAPIVQYQELLA